MIIGKHGTRKKKMALAVDVSVIQILSTLKASKVVVWQNGLGLQGDGHLLDLLRCSSGIHDHG